MSSQLAMISNRMGFVFEPCMRRSTWQRVRPAASTEGAPHSTDVGSTW
jgi:hypothetical protein